MSSPIPFQPDHPGEASKPATSSLTGEITKSVSWNSSGVVTNEGYPGLRSPYHQAPNGSILL
ncbi:MAG: hypothetical protein MJE77_14745 [Proteobacteria bacterium]|nr:hypothetical protein [Pseudomonadota bacterium]